MARWSAGVWKRQCSGLYDIGAYES